MKGVEIGKTSKKYLEPKKKARKFVYQAKCKAEKKRFGNNKDRDDQKYDVFKTAKRSFQSFKKLQNTTFV